MIFWNIAKYVDQNAIETIVGNLKHCEFQLSTVRFAGLNLVERNEGVTHK